MTVQLDSQTLFQYSYRRGLVIFLYGVAWLAAMVAGYLLVEPLFGSGETILLMLMVATWSAGLAGGLGGAAAMLNRLYQHIAVEQNFEYQPLALYFIQPVSGVMVGILSLFLISLPGALLVNLVADPGASLTDIFSASTFVAVQLLLAWIAGFRQEVGLEKLKEAGQRFMPAAPTVPVSVQPDEAEPLLFREWYQREQRVRRWSFTWGIFILGYGLACLIGLIASTILAIRFLPGLESGRHIAPNLILAAWPVATAGGMGGVLSMLRSLYEHVSVARDFDRRRLMAYLVQPVLGAVFGLASYLLLAAGFLNLEAITSTAAPPRVIDAPVLLMIQLVVGWLAGFRNPFIAGLINQVINQIVALIKLVGKLLDPRTLFNKAKRRAALAEVRSQAGFLKVHGQPGRVAVATEEEENLSDWFTR